MNSATKHDSIVTVARHFSKEGVSPYDEVQWEERTASITSSTGEVIFEQKNIRVPKSWSATATNIVASKYFYGKTGSNTRETGVDQLVQRVVATICTSGMKQGYFDAEGAAVFAAELTCILLNQIAAFNSPVWFNVGCDLYEPDAKASSWHWESAVPGSVDVKQVLHSASGYKNPQCSACFINSIQDSMEGIMKLATTEAMLFKFGSGTGTNFSTLRSSKESVSGGGVASGPLSFMKGLDSFAGVIKSGGKTRRAAKIAILNVDHPDIEEFIDCKVVEDRKARTLMAAGYDGTSGPDSIAYSSVQYQNANNSVRASDEFMRAYKNKQRYTIHAVKDGREVSSMSADQIMNKIAEAAWQCGDPGMQFDDTINKWHTCKNTARINASNPCSEYMFLDDSACNLASINLLKFLESDGTFDVKGFRATVRTMIIAQDILVDLSGYPTESIARNSHDYRPLGLGYANLGALLMALGLPYDSDEGRGYAAGITSLMTGEAYATSAYIASVMPLLEPASKDLYMEQIANNGKDSGACPGWFLNKDPFMQVIHMHAEASTQTKAPGYILDESDNAWRDAIETGRTFGYRNSQVTVLAPTGTIGFMMDCDTTGIEPELSLIKYKKLVGGGQLKIVNETVPQTLKKLGYTSNSAESILAFISAEGTPEGSGIKAEHFAIFDTAFRPSKGTRSIHYSGHIKMMGAVQPFLSGAISKTVNLPNEAKPDDILKAYVEGWELGLKSIAVYRDGSKSNQPMVTGHVKAEAVDDKTLIEIINRRNGNPPPSPELLAAVDTQWGKYLLELNDKPDSVDSPPRSVRHRMPVTRQAINHKFSISGHEGYLNVGMYKNGQPGEIFITMSKEGSTISGLMDSLALSLSIALQYGVPLETLVSKLSHTRFEPSGWTDNPDIKFAKSISDYIARWLGSQFMPNKGKNELDEPILIAVGSSKTDLSSMMETSDSPPCPQCGCITVRSGSCYRCLECGSTTGCS